MNLLIPTNDGISIAPDFDGANKFRILSVNNGSIDKDEIISSGKQKLGQEYHYIVIANSISKKTEKELNEKKFDVVLTTETNITNAIIYYLKYHAVNESDYCCCP